MNSVIKSEDLNEMIYSILYKAQSEPIEQRDLDKIKSITLQETKMSGKPTDINPKEIGLFTNLEHLIINGFDIDDELMGIINSLPKLKTIQFTKSRFKTEKSLNVLMEYEIIDRCENPGKAVGNSKKIKIVGDKKNSIDLNSLGDLSQVEEFDLNDLDVNNIARVQQMPKLAILDLCGSNIDDAASIAELPIKTKLEDEYLII